MDAVRFAIARSESAESAAREYAMVHNSSVASALRIVRDLYKKVEPEDLRSRQSRNILWHLYTRLTFTLLPFSDARLAFHSQLDSLMGDPAFRANHGTSLKSLSKHYSDLFLMPSNPKLARIIELCAENNSSVRGRSALLCGVSTRPELEGWPLGAIEQVSSSLPNVRIIRSLRELGGNIPDILIVPAGAHRLNASERIDLALGGLSKLVIFCAYDGERIVGSSELRLSGGREISSLMMPRPQASPPHVYELPESATEPDDPIWTSLREHGLSGAAGGHEILEGRWVLFERGEAVCLPEKAAVLEYSELLNNPASKQERVPRIDVAALRPGHVLLLRKSGSGEHLDAVADGLMKKDKDSGLRGKTKVWRDALRRALSGDGVQKVRGWLREESGNEWAHGFTLPLYTSSLVIGPQSRNRFAVLVRVLARFGYLQISELDHFVDLQWRYIEKIRSYQRRAAIELRHELLQSLQHRIRNGESLLGQDISLPGVDAGEMTLLRVAAVDERSTDVVFHQLYRLV